ncbi:MAG TPA: DUF5681 domain-containing protein [Isosphaeraceae bacterium]|jgi:hypothetical protein|nr:DUF5681 domain-containing protein [Isosphaeraceae bacterium]
MDTLPRPTARDGQGRFAPGSSGNPKGRPKAKGRRLADILRERLDSDTYLNGLPIADGKLLGDLLVEALIGHAIQGTGNGHLFALILDRVDGPVPKAAPPEAFSLADLAAEAALIAGSYTPEEPPESSP